MRPRQRGCWTVRAGRAARPSPFCPAFWARGALPAARRAAVRLTRELGDSKTTLLNYVLETAPHKRIAVIENEFGEEIGCGGTRRGGGGRLTARQN